MGREKRVAIIFGTRPEAIKTIPVILELRRYPGQIQPIIIVTAQHRDMLDQVMSLFGVEPDFDLDIMRENQSLIDLTKRATTELDRVLRGIRPDLVIVHGDTTTTLMGALVSFYHHIPVGHLEAGLRTYNRYSPYPEEMNRHLVAVLAELHFAPTLTSKENLFKEGVRNGVFVTGNTVIDALLSVAGMEYNRRRDPFGGIGFGRRRIILVTAHRRENWGRPLENICLALLELIRLYEDVEIVYPVHPNPNVSHPVQRLLGGRERIHLLSPLDYHPFVHLMKMAFIVMTDSGGIQEEAPSLGKPVLVLREVTERPEAVEAGTVKVVGTEKERVVHEASLLLDNEDEYQRMARAVNPYGDGKAALRVVGAVRYHLGLIKRRPDEFQGPSR